MSIVLIASATALFAAAPTTTHSTPARPNAPAPVAAPVADAEVRHCVTFQMTGFSPPRRECKTREMWIGTQDFDPVAPRK